MSTGIPQIRPAAQDAIPAPDGPGVQVRSRALRLCVAAAVVAAFGTAAWLLRDARSTQPTLQAAIASSDLAGVVAWGVPVEMEENDRVINVSPHVTVDPRGGYLVADRREAQVRRYREDGRLRRVTGRKGSGAGEFRSLSSVSRMRDGRLVAAEMGGKLSVFDPAGERLLATRMAPVAPLYDAEVLDARHLLVAGRRVGTGGTSLVHVVDAETGAITRSFFGIPRHDVRLAAGYAFAGTADAVARGDTVAAVFALSDSIYLFDTTGRELGRVTIPFEHFRRLTRPMPISGATVDAFRAWGETFSAISQLYWLRDGSFLVQYYDMRGVEPQWRLLHMDRSGRRLFERLDTPRLLAAGGPADELVFVHPSADAPNVWVSARLRP